MKCNFCQNNLEWLGVSYCSVCSIYSDSDRGIVLFNNPVLINKKVYRLLLDYKTNKTNVYHNFQAFHILNNYNSRTVKPLIIINSVVSVNPSNLEEKIHTLLVWS